MKSFLALALLGAASAIDAPTHKYMQYLSKFNKSYASLEEFNMRLANFAAIDDFITEFNSNPENTSTVGHNFLSDWTAAEKKVLNGYLGEIEPIGDVPEVETNQSVPAAFDWINNGNIPGGNVGPV
jgi:hypothetical protein